MAFSFKNSKGVTYYLHSRKTELKSGKNRQLFFFSKEQSGGEDRVPEGYEVAETQTGLPVIKKKGGKEAAK
jgi:hypothetical protein